MSLPPALQCKKKRCTTSERVVLQNSIAYFWLCASSDSLTVKPPPPHTHTRSIMGSIPWSSVSKEGRLLSNKCKGVMASYWLLPEINTGLLLCLTLTEKSPHLRILACHNPFSISYPPISYSKPNSSHPFFPRLDSSECIFQVLSALKTFEISLLGQRLHTY